MSKHDKAAKKVTFDTETRGLFGKIVLCGWFDGESMHYCKPEDLIKKLDAYAKKNECDIYAYAHNLDFDIAKLYKYGGNIDIDFSSKTIIIDKRICRAHIKGTDVYLCDSLKLFPASLEQLSKDFDLQYGKKHIDIKAMGYKDKTDFFEHVDENNPVFREYFEYDCRALYELLDKAIELSGLSESEFVKCPTAPSLAMKIFRKKYPDNYDKIVNVHNPVFLEDFFRSSYVGARTEVFKPKLEGQGYHYDVNSLYPYVMMKYEYPVGYPTAIYDMYNATAAYEQIKSGSGKYACGIFYAHIKQPDTFLPVLPFRGSDKLYFPIGEFDGYWTDIELMEAEKQGAIVEIKAGVCWMHKEPIFRDFITELMHEKINSKGARRSFFKLMQNSFYGKWGMNRNREVYYNYTPEKEQELKDKGIPYVVTRITKGLEIICAMRRFNFIEYIHPEIAAYITSYARLELYRALKAQIDAGANIYYCDTDSMVTDLPLPIDMVDDKKYGKWKLERTIKEAIFLQPKFYAEKTDNGKYELKSKGLIKQYREKICYDTYKELLQRAERGETVLLYEGEVERRKFLTSLLKGKDIDEPVYLWKAIDFKRQQKRGIDYINNETWPIKIFNIGWDEKRDFAKAFKMKYEEKKDKNVLIKLYKEGKIRFDKLPKDLQRAIKRIELIQQM